MEESEKSGAHEGAEPSAESSVKKKLQSALNIPDSNIPIEVKSFPRVTDSEFRLACHDIAEALSGNWKFKLQVIGAMVSLFLAVAVAGFGILGLTIKDTATDEIKQAQERVSKQINDEFQTDKVQTIVQQVASTNAAVLIQTSIQPAIDKSKKTLADFNQHLEDQQAIADKELATFRDDLAQLQRRNEITSLADQAIEGGDVKAFHKLRDMAMQSSPPPGSDAELLRVFEAYSIFSPRRWVGAKLNAKAIDPKKEKEEDLDSNNLLMVIGNPNLPAPARGRAAELLAGVAKVGSYSTAKAIVGDIQRENHLEVIKRLQAAFFHVVPSFVEIGDIDGEGILDWWKTHSAEVQKADTDAKK